MKHRKKITHRLLEEKFKSFPGFCNVFKSDDSKKRKYGKIFKYCDKFGNFHLIHNAKEICVAKGIWVFADHFEYVLEGHNGLISELFVPKPNQVKKNKKYEH